VNYYKVNPQNQLLMKAKMKFMMKLDDQNCSLFLNHKYTMIIWKWATQGLTSFWHKNKCNLATKIHNNINNKDFRNIIIEQRALIALKLEIQTF
jgi:hypothetical protein